MHLAVYTDYPYHLVDDEVYAERAFAVFLSSLASHVDHLTVIGRLDPHSTRGRYPLGKNVSLVALPHYPRLSDPVPAIRSMAGSLAILWREIKDVDRVWILGPHPLAFPLAMIARLRHRPIVLGVRQHTPDYIRHRHPGRHGFLAIANAMEWGFRMLGRTAPVVAVGPAIAENYSRSKQLLAISVSLIDENDIVMPQDAARRNYDGDLVVLSVGRIEHEKNPLLLADVLQKLLDRDDRWKLVVCGEGSLEGALAERLRELGVAERADLVGYVPLDEGLKDLYRKCHMLLHVSWTEGLPQVLFEGFAAGVPVIATDVGGVRAAVGSAVCLIPPGDPEAAVDALEKVRDDPALRKNLLEKGYEMAIKTTLQAECARVARFIAEA